MSQELIKKILKYFREKELFLTLLGGFLFVIISSAVLLTAIYFQSLRHHPEKGEIVEAGSQVEQPLEQQVTLEVEPLGQHDDLKIVKNMENVETEVYVVQAGDSLWKVAQNKYGDGLKYLYLAQVNHLAQDSWLEIGQQLVIPRLNPEEQSDQIQPTVALPTLEGQYLVQPGDCLSTIAYQQLGVEQDWVEIYRINRQIIGDDPDLIYQYMVLQLSDDRLAMGSFEYRKVQK